MNAEIVTAIVGLITICLGFVFFYFPWQTLVVDQTRQRLFEIRDEWFDYSQTLAATGDREAAEKVRMEINYLIRLTHKVTFPVLVVAWTGKRLFHKDLVLENPVDVLITGFQTREVAKRAATTILQ